MSDSGPMTTGDEADIAALEARARAGEADAKAALGKRLILSGGDPDTVRRGAQLVAEAAAAGDPTGLTLQALFAATGLFVPQNWDAAFDLCAQAAEAGSDFAQGQLAALAGERDRDAVTSWRALRSALDIAALMRAPPAIARSDSPRLSVVPRFAGETECAWLMERAANRLKRARIYDAVNEAGAEDEGRNNSDANFPFLELDLVILILQQRMARLTPIPLFGTDAPTVLHYVPGQRFDAHFDYLNPATPSMADDLARCGQRITTFLIYLNEDFEGGETDFPDAGLRVRGKAGEGVFWSNVKPDGAVDPMTRHVGLGPTRGEKWVFSQWIRDRPQSW